MMFNILVRSESDCPKQTDAAVNVTSMPVKTLFVIIA